MKTETAIFASGCFWGTQFYFEKAKGVISTAVGYIGGSVENPTYQQVSSGRTGHAEATEVTYDPSQTNYENMVKLFYETHNPGQLNRQGPDIGTQYRSEIFYQNDEQKRIAEKLTEELKAKGYDVVTAITKAGPFYRAEDYHQMYYGKSGGSPYCHIYTRKF
jgi:peptide methionine sulfoxide reductase msrA/msrB